MENSQNSDLTLKVQLRDLLDDTSEPPKRQPIALLPSHHSTAKLHDNPFALLQILPLSASSVRGGGEEAGRGGDGGAEEPRSNQLKGELELIDTRSILMSCCAARFIPHLFSVSVSVFEQLAE